MSQPAAIYLTFSPKQAQFLASKKLRKAFCGGRGAGKSFVGWYDAIKRSRPKRQYMVVVPTYNHLEKYTIPSLEDVTGKIRMPFKYNKTDSIVRLGNQSKFFLCSTEDPERQLVGPNLSGVWLDEAGLMPDTTLQYIAPTLREGGEQGWLNATFTPKGKKHWTYRVFGKGDPNTELIHATTSENPFLPENFEADLRKDMPSYLANQELGGQFTDPPGAVYQRGWFARYITDNDVFRFPNGNVWKHDDMQRFAVLDPAIGKKKDADPTALTVFARTPNNDAPILDSFNHVLPIHELCPLVTRMKNKWNFDYLICEANGFQMLVAKDIREKCKILVREVDPKGKSKLARSARSIIMAESGQVYLPKDEPWVEPWLDEIASFTGEEGAEDGQADCLSYGCREMVEGQQFWTESGSGGHAGGRKPGIPT